MLGVSAGACDSSRVLATMLKHSVYLEYEDIGPECSGLVK